MTTTDTVTPRMTAKEALILADRATAAVVESPPCITVAEYVELRDKELAAWEVYYKVQEAESLAAMRGVFQ